MAAQIILVGLSNLAVAGSIALLAMAASRWGWRPALTHALWLLVILKLVTPPVLDLPLRLLPAEAVAVSEQSSSVPVAAPAEPATEPLASSAVPTVSIVQESMKPSLKKPETLSFSGAGLISESTEATTEIVSSQRDDTNSQGTPSSAARAGETNDLPASSLPTSSGSILSATADEPSQSRHSIGFSWIEAIAAVWLGGSVLWVALTFNRIRRFSRNLQAASEAPAWIVQEIAAMARKLGLSSSPRVKLLPGAVAPMVWSLGRRTIYLPAELLDRLSTQQRISIVAHEMAHLKRGDHIVRWLELAASVLYWWCPLFWHARRELMRAEEECCDAWVVASLPTAGHAYASAILDTLDYLAEAPCAPALASGMGSAAAIKRRLLLILDGRTPKRLPLVGRLMVVFFALLLLPIAPKLARIASADAMAEEPNQAKTPAAAQTDPAPVAKSPPTLLSTNPRGESLLFETGSSDIRPGGTKLWSVSISPNGKTIATSQGDQGGSKGEVKIWDVATGKITKVIQEPKGVRSVAFSPDGKLLATGNYDWMLRIYDTATFTLRAVGQGHKFGINGVCFFKNGKYLATAGLDNTARIWDISALESPETIHEQITVPFVAVFEGHTQGLLSVSVSADGKTLLTGSLDRTARCYDVPNPLPAAKATPAQVKKERVLLQNHTSAVEAVAVSPDGQVLATASWDAQVILRDRDGKDIGSSFRFQALAMCLAFTADGKYLVAGAGNMGDPPGLGEIRVWDVADKKEAAYRGDYPGAVLGVALSPDGKTVVSVGVDQAVSLWPFAQKERKTLSQPGLAYTPQPILAAAVSPDDSLLAFSGETRSVFIFNRSNNKLVAELTGHEDVVAGLAFSPDGTTLATASYDKSIKLWNTQSWEERRSLAGHTGWVFGVAFSPDGKLIASGSYDKTLRIWNVQTGESKAILKEHSAGIRSIAFSPDGKKLVSGGSDRIPRVWDIAEGKVLFALKGHKNAVRSVAFSPVGKSVASGSEDQTVKLWDVESGKETHTFSGLSDMVTAIKYSPKGQTLAASTFQGPILLLDPLSKRTRQILRAHNESVSAVLFADDGQHLISVSQDRTIRQWSVSKTTIATPAQALSGKPGFVTSTAIAPDGNTAVLGTIDGSTFAWNLRTDALQPCVGSHPGGIAQIAISDALQIVSVGKDGTFIVGSLPNKELWRGKGSYAVFTPNGKQLAVADGKDIVLFEAATGNEVKRFTGGHDSNVVRLEFSPDGTKMISAGQETKVRLWNVATGRKLQETPAFDNESAITNLAFSSDGNRIAIAAFGPNQPSPDSMVGNFRPVREVRVFPVPSPEGNFDKPITMVNQPADQPIAGLHWTSNPVGLVIVTPNGIVRLMEINANGANERQRFNAHESTILSSAVSLAGGALITAGEDMAVRRWRLLGIDPAPGQARVTSPGLTRVWTAMPSPNGKYVVTAGEGDKAFRVHESIPSAIPVEPDRYQAVTAMAISPDGRFLVTGHGRGALLVRDAATGKVLRTLTGFTKAFGSIAFAEKGAALIIAGGNQMNGKDPGEAIVFDFPEGKVRHKLNSPAYQTMIATHPDGKSVALSASDGRVRVYDLATGKVTTTYGTGGPIMKVVAFDSTGKRIAAGGFDHAIRIWDTSTGAELMSISTAPLLPTKVLFSPDGKELVVSTWQGSGQPAQTPTLSVYSLADPAAVPRQFATHTASVMGAAFLPDGKTLISAGGENGIGGSLRVYDFATGRQIGQLNGHRHWVQAMAVSDDGKRVASTSWALWASGELRLWDPRGFRPLTEVKVPGENHHVTSGAIGLDSKLLVLGGFNHNLTAWDMTDPTKPVLRKQLKEHTTGLRSVVFDDAGKRFVSTDESGTVKVWDATSLDLIVSFQASTQAVYRARFTPDGTKIVTVGGDWKARVASEMKIWDAKTGQEIGRFPDQPREVWDVAFVNGGKLMAAIPGLSSGPGEAFVKIWDFEKRQIVQSLLPPGTFTNGRCLAVSPDGKYLAVGSGSGPVKVFETNSWSETLSIPNLTDCTFRVEFTPDSGNLLIASGEGAALSVRLPR